MTKLDLINDAVLSKVYANILTFEEADEIMRVAYIMYENVFDNIIDKYRSPAKRKEIFKKQYGFVPLHPTTPDVGIITDKSGNKFVIDLSSGEYIIATNPIKNVNGSAEDYGLCSEISTGKIFTDKEFWDLDKRDRDASIHHEMGHSKMHSANADNPSCDYRYSKIFRTGLAMYLPPKVTSMLVKASMHRYLPGIQKYFADNATKDADERLINLRKYIYNEYIDSYKKAWNESKFYEEYKENPHLKVSEVEADVYSQLATGGMIHSREVIIKKDKEKLKRIEEIYLRRKESDNLTDEFLRDYQRTKEFYNLDIMEQELLIKAMKDPKLLNSGYYKNNKIDTEEDLKKATTKNDKKREETNEKVSKLDK